MSILCSIVDHPHVDQDSRVIQFAGMTKKRATFIQSGRGNYIHPRLLYFRHHTAPDLQGLRFHNTKQTYGTLVYLPQRGLGLHSRNLGTTQWGRVG